jgi:trimeric autotransporter adhesin
MKRKYLPLLLSLAFIATLIAQDKMYIFKSDGTTLGVLVSKIDSLLFIGDGSTARFVTNTTSLDCEVSKLDSITFGNDSRIISITYNGSTVVVVNPLAFEGVTVLVNGADVTVTSTLDSTDVTYRLAGNTSDGSFKIYSDHAFTLELNGVSITNADGSAINIQSHKAVYTRLTDGTTNTLSDAANYADAPTVDGVAEDQDAAFFSEGQLIFSGTGNLNINGKGTKKHALCSDDYIQINSGNITINSALKDGIHGKTGVSIQGGTVKVTSTGDGIDGDTGFINITGGSTTVTCSSADVNAICCDSTLNISGGTVAITLGGAQSKGIKSGREMTLSGGSIVVTASGAAVLEATATIGRYDPAYCAAIKCDALITASGANITITHSGAGGKGISSGIGFVQTSGTVNITVSGAGSTYVDETGVNDYYNATGITTDGTIDIQGGTLTIINSSAASKGLSANGTISLTGGTIAINPQGGAVTTVVSGSGFDPKYCTAIKSTTNVTMDGATVTLTMTGAAAKGISTGTNFLMNSGTLGITSTGAGGTYKNSLGTTDGYQSTCITSDGTLSILGGTVTTSSIGTGGKGLNATGVVTLGTTTTSPTINIKTTGADIANGTNREASSYVCYAGSRGINSNGAISINNGDITIYAINDGIKSESTIIISKATVNITNSYEGIEANFITVNSGSVNITSTDDCFNATTGTGSQSTSGDGSLLTIAGGNIYASGLTGDALDSNGSISISGGNILIHGPNSQPEVGMDYNKSCTLTGGFLVVSGTNSNMTQSVTSATQPALKITFSTQLAAGSLFHIQNSSGTDILTFKPNRAYYSIVFSSSVLTKNTSYSIYTGGTCTGTLSNGLYTGGLYSGGTWKKTFSTSSSSWLNTVTF